MSSEAPTTTATPSPVQPPKKRRWLRILLWVVVAFAIFIGAVVGFAFWATSGVVDAVDRQLSAIRKGDYQAAYNETALALRDKLTLADFEAFVKRYPILANNTSHSFSNRSIKDKVGTVEGTLSDARGATTPVQYRLVKENDNWRIIYIHIGPKPAVSGGKKK